MYNAHERDLPCGGRDVLPDSDLLKSVHRYSSKFYAAMGRRNRLLLENGGSSAAIGRRSVDERSMDETALLAFGILLEEAGREMLGRRGDLVFTEGRVVGADGSSGDEVARDLETTVGYRDVGSELSEGTNRSTTRKRLAKRRRLADSEGLQD